MDNDSHPQKKVNDTLFDIDFVSPEPINNDSTDKPFRVTDDQSISNINRDHVIPEEIIDLDRSDNIINDENPFNDQRTVDWDTTHLDVHEPDFSSAQNGGFFSRMFGRKSAAVSQNNYNSVTTSDFDDSYTNSRDQFNIKILFNKYILRKNVSGSIDTTKPRIINMNDRHSNSEFSYCDNHISTTKYNVATFLPKFLFQEFSKYANLFFLCTSAIQQVPNVSPTNRYTTIGTLMCVLIVSAMKEIIEDTKRATSDKELNNSIVEIYNDGEFIKKRWIDIKVGDIIKVNSEEAIPADLIIVSSSEPEGLCYIETANLDGETNLKIKQSKAETSGFIDSRQLKSLTGKVLSEQPNSSLYTYEGTMELGNQRIPLSPEQMILRGATLRNTAWITGLVIFTGHETKLMRNATATPIKRTAVERVINMQIIALFGVLIVLILISSIGNVIMSSASKHLSYLYLEGTSKVGLFFKDFLTFWILFSNLVPISLFVTVELIKYYQAFMIGSDLDLYYEETDTPTVVRTSSLVEELGQIEYIFSDKTGTLTRNIMEFKSCSIAGHCYIETIPEDKKASMEDGIEIGYRSFDDMKERLYSGNDAEESGTIDIFLTLLAICHTVIPEDIGNGQIKYQAASPDEGALVQGASDLGFKFIIRKPNSVTVLLESGEEKQFELLNVCEFNSTRKRMSAIFRFPDGSIKLLCKGADTVILERLGPNNMYIEPTTRHLEDYASEGLRTLCLGYRDIPEQEYISWKTTYDEAATTMENRSEKLDAAAELIEKDLTLIGATAIEDKLQDEVPDTIHTLQEAGIKIWVLTGDRQETAINIGMSCRLLGEDMNLLIVNEETKEDTRKNLVEKINALHEHDISEQEKDTLALVIDGKSLGYALEPDLEDYLLYIGKLCKAVICCRVSPLQKALVVKMVKRKTSSLLLAIGDGANDVSMIQAAHVGVGISGMEGMQAARSADIAVGQFKFLKKLLIVHGSWSYQRISMAILYSFYKNTALYMTQFWYVFANGFSGQSIMESWTMSFYNLFFTVLPPFVMGVFDQFVSSRLLERYPQLYKLGQKGQFFSVTIFWSWIINGFYHSAVVFIGTILFYRYGSALNMHGEVADHWTWGVSVYTTSILIVLGKAALITNQWTKFTFVAIPGSFLFWLVFFPIYGSIFPYASISREYFGVVPHTYRSGVFWLTLLVLPMFALLRDFAWKYYRRMYVPETYHLVQEMQKYNINDYRPHIQHFQDAIRKVRQVQRMKKQRGFAFSQAEEGGQEKIIRMYDTTLKRGKFGELADASANVFDDNAINNDTLTGNYEVVDDISLPENPFADTTTQKDFF
ncbi:similar to Saccharomyces cerevisiae YAL026C DRS2 Aminophospholipid translocase (flippase) that maintains membrane lipid asymmetry in post-Golgi secretory vesicles [Maudiozyma saulgeensis]|uniref:Phospholipid-transporting ATPase n=1 Tax=Maudiozyma saulgeensis TaxID=1789683 RepID=A0A1X7R7Q6_9SACH|nr:similar to Saccharomyces cerevisiae YAL026C DRS2 Aminophospholipid translocase (flippase) that maintains membrane lipid asymmetry in post-Golgi secretory vesicles [Kazachstania saulgeensis]